MKIESIGTYIGEITESVFGLTNKAQLPQAVLRLKAEKKYIESPDDIKWFQENKKLLLDGAPAYVDWSEYDESIVGFFLLFSTKNDKPTLNADQLLKATGWTFPRFDQLPSLVGQRVMFQVREKKGYTNDAGQFVTQAGELEVSWIDHVDASPERTLKGVDEDQVKALMNQYKAYAVKAPAKPATFTAAPTVAKPPATAAPNAASNVQTTTTPAATATMTTTATPPAKAPPKRKPKTEAAAVPSGTTQLDAWNAVNAAKGDVPDKDMETIWCEAVGEVLGDRAENTATSADWDAVKTKSIERLEALLRV